jgi:hypothetical protein
MKQGLPGMLFAMCMILASNSTTRRTYMAAIPIKGTLSTLSLTIDRR